MAAQMGSDKAPFSGFFKVIFQRALQDKKLMISTKFVGAHSNLFMDHVNLIVPNGQSWEIGLAKFDDKIYFDRNWQEFTQHFSIQKEYFLTFRLKQISTLKVRIFHPSGCEIRYPFRATTSAHKTNLEEGECSNGKAMQEWRTFTTEMPCFKILMQPYHFKYKIVHLPTEFGTILKRAPEQINLQNSKGQKWRVRLGKQVAERKYDRFRLGNGWGEFVEDNHMKIGDVCAIEIIDDNLWKVTIFRD
ncbi:B3 domain-containing transcription factor VRN1-like [Mercurialis annua]|uniref:B3 domain-containing transcription factor VRN1-like n=1 Tax=Mercurialis annua TaxID=3986 RepID=UPI00215E166A|nr:B3 domain-containing transcription factor VRN1-like [Mercurialis annua]